MNVTIKIVDKRMSYPAGNSFPNKPTEEEYTLAEIGGELPPKMVADTLRAIAHSIDPRPEPQFFSAELGSTIDHSGCSNAGEF